MISLTQSRNSVRKGAGSDYDSSPVEERFLVERRARDYLAR